MTDNDMPDIPTDVIAETDNYSVWLAEEPDGETTYHLELGAVTVHFFDEEWDEFVELIRQAAGSAESGTDEDVEVELDWGSLYFTRDEWVEFLSLVNQAGN
jgi:hypothetical protein